MLIVLSPAKTLDFESPLAVQEYTLPDFLDQSQQLVALLRRLSPAELAGLMGISDPLAVLNDGRYAAWSRPFVPENARQAILAFNGDVYEGLDAATLSNEDLRFAQNHLRILSGLYGILRPLDLMQPYRLEMGTRLANAKGKDLYAFWGERLTVALNETARQSAARALVNLASEEYFRAIRPKDLAIPVIQPVFEDWSGGKYKVVSFFAKKARGLMARHALIHRLTSPEGLQGFDAAGYAYAPEASEELRWVFRRKSADAGVQLSKIE